MSYHPFAYLDKSSPLERTDVSGMPKDALDNVTRRSLRPSQQIARQQLAGADLMPIPAYSAMIVAAANNEVTELYLPDQASVLVVYAPQNQVFYLAFGARCLLPPVRSNLSGDYAPNDMIVSPVGVKFYVKDLKSVSIGLPVAGAFVSVVCWTQLP